jgi:hypothetical protein
VKNESLIKDTAAIITGQFFCAFGYVENTEQKMLGKRKKESAYKPGFVENSHSSRLQVTLQLKQSTQEPRGPRVCPSI